MDKPYVRSLTVMAGLVTAVVTYLESVGWLPAGSVGFVSEAEGHVVSVLGHLVDLVQVSGGFLTLVGLRRAHGAAVNAARGVAPLFLACLLLAGCASYDRLGLTVAASTWASAPPVPIVADECEAFRSASAGLEAGPDRSLLVLGRGSTLRDLAPLFAEHAVQCDRALALQENGLDVSRTGDAFRRSWSKLGEVVR